MIPSNTSLIPVEQENFCNDIIIINKLLEFSYLKGINEPLQGDTRIDLYRWHRNAVSGSGLFNHFFRIQLSHELIIFLFVLDREWSADSNYINKIPLT